MTASSEKKESGKVLDLDKYEFSDQIKNTDRWQTEVEQQLTYQIKQALVQSVRYRETIREQYNNFTPAAAHNTVLIEGDRGTGKSYFLRSMPKAWRDSLQVILEPMLKRRVHFCGLIDPTLLNVADKFTNVVVAHLFNEVQEKLTVSNEGESFHRVLRELAESMEAVEEQNATPGLDRIINYRTAVKIEQNFHRFIEACLSVLNVDLLVLPIDDVDMELSRAYEVLEVIRRLLSCPLIIPVVSGNLELFHKLLSNVFQDSLKESDSMDSSPTNTSISLTSRVTNEYLIKLFPPDSRLPLRALADFVDTIKLKNHNIGKLPEGEEIILNVSSFHQVITEMQHPFLNGRDYSLSIGIPLTPRKLTIFIRLFLPYFPHEYSKDIAKTVKFWEISKHYLSESGYQAFSELAESEKQLVFFRNRIKSGMSSIGLQFFDTFPFFNSRNFNAELDELHLELTFKNFKFLDRLIPQTKKAQIKSLIDLYAIKVRETPSNRTYGLLSFIRIFEILSVSFFIDTRELGNYEWIEKLYRWVPTRTASPKLEEGQKIQYLLESFFEDESSWSKISSSINEWQSSNSTLLSKLRNKGLVPLFFFVMKNSLIMFNRIRLLMLKDEFQKSPTGQKVHILTKNSEGIVFSETRIVQLHKLVSVVIVNSLANYITNRTVVPFDLDTMIGDNHLLNYIGMEWDVKTEHFYQQNIDAFLESEKEEALHKELLKCVMSHPLITLDAFN